MGHIHVHQIVQGGLVQMGVVELVLLIAHLLVLVYLVDLYHMQTAVNLNFEYRQTLVVLIVLQGDLLTNVIQLIHQTHTVGYYKEHVV